MKPMDDELFERWSEIRKSGRKAFVGRAVTLGVVIGLAFSLGAFLIYKWTVAPAHQAAFRYVYWGLLLGIPLFCYVTSRRTWAHGERQYILTRQQKLDEDRIEDAGETNAGDAEHG